MALSLSIRLLAQRRGDILVNLVIILFMLDKLNTFGEGAAQVHYGSPELTILRPGRFVRCAVTGNPIALEELRYWSVELQEAYVDATAANQRWLTLNKRT
jgi:hypothetical protein